MKLRTACTRDCPDACGLVVTIENGRATKLQGDPEHPVTQGFLCYRTSRFLKRQYDPDRLMQPMLRGRHDFKPIGWDAALDLIAEKMLRIKSEHGGAAILHYKSGGSLGLMKHVSEHFFERFGPVTIKSGDICSGAGETAQETDFGISDSHDLEDLKNARAIVNWGKNVHVSNVHLIPLLKEVQANGTKLVLIDPIRHRGADLADVYIQPKPGGDLALALGTARCLLESGRWDAQLEHFAEGIEGFTDLVRERSIEAWAQAAEVTVAELELLADIFANGPTALLVGWGLQRKALGSTTVRALDALGLVSGNIGVPGGGVSFYFQRRAAFNLSWNGGIETAPRAIPEPLLGKGILEAEDPPIRMVWITCGNPVAMLPDSKTVAHALRSRELTVVVDTFLTDSAREAHLVLPTTTMLEDDDFVGAFGNHQLSEVKPVLESPGEVRSDYAIIRGLAQRLQMGAPFDRDIEDWKAVLLEDLNRNGVTKADFESGSVRNPTAPMVLFEDKKFPTSSGKARLLQSVDWPTNGEAQDFPLTLIAVSTEKSQASQWSTTLEGPLVATVHPEAANGFQDGTEVLLESTMGTLPVRLKLDERQRKDIVHVPKGGWLVDDRCANALIEAKATDAGGGACYYDTAVRIIPQKE